MAEHRRGGMGRNDDQEFQDKVIDLNRVSKVVKGGRRFAFSALVVVGDGKGRVGMGKGKAREVPEAIRKATEHARRNLVSVPLDNGTIPHDVLGKFGAGLVMLRPAGAGTGVIAGSGIRAVMELAGVHNVITKCIGTNNPHNMLRATFNAIDQMRSAEEIARRRGKTVEEILA
jgi:small subunit ribosomal protein S5